MEVIKEFIKPELLILVPVLNIIGMMFKDSNAFDDRHIPSSLGGIGILLAALWVIGTSASTLGSANEIVLAVFTAIVQGVICAGLAVYGNQLIKQATDDEEYEE